MAGSVPVQNDDTISPPSRCTSPKQLSEITQLHFLTPPRTACAAANYSKQFQELHCEQECTYHDVTGAGLCPGFDHGICSVDASPSGRSGPRQSGSVHGP